MKTKGLFLYTLILVQGLTTPGVHCGTGGDGGEAVTVVVNTEVTVDVTGGRVIVEKEVTGGTVTKDVEVTGGRVTKLVLVTTVVTVDGGRVTNAVVVETMVDVMY